MKYYVVDAFTDTLFKGNPAGVCLLDNWPEDSIMQNIAAENNLAETAFVVREGDTLALRWFTPAVEIDLCGHATLATAYVLSEFTDINTDKMSFATKSGILTVVKKDDMFEMDFPSRKPTPVEITDLMLCALGTEVVEAHSSRDLLLLLSSEEQVRNLKPDPELMKNIPGAFGIIVTAKGGEVDFVSRFFAPNAGVPEDPVTGSSHSTLIPFWSERLGKKEMVARQLSARGGALFCKNEADRVKIAGKTVLYMTGHIHI